MLKEGEDIATYYQLSNGDSYYSVMGSEDQLVLKNKVKTTGKKIILIAIPSQTKPILFVKRY